MDYQEASKLRERSKKMYGLTVILMLTYTLISIFIIKQTTGGQAWYWGLLKASPCVVLMSNVLLRLTGRPNASNTIASKLTYEGTCYPLSNPIPSIGVF
jgi:hypothetical protein